MPSTSIVGATNARFPITRARHRARIMTQHTSGATKIINKFPAEIFYLERRGISHGRMIFRRSVKQKVCEFAGFLMHRACLPMPGVSPPRLTSLLMLFLLFVMRCLMGWGVLGRMECSGTRTFARWRRTRFMRLRHHANRLPLLGSRRILMPH